ncbi:hypothetical protein RV09_GL002896 [Enterococcus moraviensis]|nr:hypothetical protein RV09_GL002896 [Enterococcus moraviensis]
MNSDRKSPSSVTAEIVVIPETNPVRFPSSVIVATALSELCHLNFGFVAFFGSTVADNWIVSPKLIVFFVESILIPVTGIFFFTTLTLQLAILLPSLVLAVTVVVPCPILFAVTFPFLSTLAKLRPKLVIERLHSTSLCEAFSGVKIGVKFISSSHSSVISLWFNSIFSKGIYLFSSKR